MVTVWPPPIKGDSAAEQLEARDGEEDDDGQGAQRLELAVPVGVILVGCSSRDPNDDQAEDVVDRVDRGVQRVAHDGQRTGVSADRHLDDDDGDVGDEQAAQHAAHRSRAV
jgi:hypothetical protein